MKVLLTGGTGLLGQALLASAPADADVTATWFTHDPSDTRAKFRRLDIGDHDAAHALVMQIRPEVVLHTASVGSVDEAERHPEEVRRVNVGGLQAIGRACGEIGARLAFISSNAVFDGANPPYDERATRGSVNRYGALKIEAEEWLESSGLEHVIFRPILMYGWPAPGGRGNVVTRWLAALETGRAFTVAQDIVSMPLFAPDAAKAIWNGVRARARGIFHLAGADRLSLLAFARAVADAFDGDQALITPVTSASFTELAPRPLDTSFIITRMRSELAVQPLGVREGLAAMKAARAQPVR